MITEMGITKLKAKAMFLLKHFDFARHLHLMFILLMLLSALIVFLQPFLYTYTIIFNFIILILAEFFISDLRIFCLLFSVLLLGLYHSRAEVDLDLCKSEYEQAFKPIMMYSCLAAYDVRERRIITSVNCKDGMKDAGRKEIETCLAGNRSILNHLESMGCSLIEISEDDLTFWYSDVCIQLSREADHSLTISVSQLH